MTDHTADGRRSVNLSIVGCGKLGTSILIGIYRAQAEDRPPFLVNILATVRSSKSKERLEQTLSDLESSFGATKSKCSVTVEIQDAEFTTVSQADLVILGCKPNAYDTFCRDNKFRLSLASSPGGTLVSLVGGASCDKIVAALHDNSAEPAALPILVVRAVPNIAAQRRMSITTLATSQHHGFSSGRVDSAISIIDQIFQMVGTSTWVTESTMNITSAIGSSAVALYATIINQVAQSACADNESISLEVMRHITAQAAYGAAGLILQGMSPTTIVENVATKGGSTQAGLDVFDAHQTHESITATITAMIKATHELGKKLPST